MAEAMDQNENSPWKYKADDGSSSDDKAPDDHVSTTTPKKTAQTVSWEAPEFIDSPHGVGWYLALIVITILLAVLVFLATSHGKVETVTIVILGIIVWFYAQQKPGQAKYEISENGISINNKSYQYSDFKSFAIIREGQLTSVNLFPLKRFMPPVAAYFDPKEEEKVVDALGNYLPYEDRKLDGIDRLTRRLRL